MPCVADPPHYRFMDQNPNGPGGVNTDRLRDVQSWRRSRSDRMIAGVCGGVGRALNIDPVLIRVVIAVLAVAGGAGIPLYIAAWVLMPEEGSDTSAAQEVLGRRARPDHPWLWPVVVGVGVFVAIGISSSLKVWPFSFPGPLVAILLIWFLVVRKKHRRRGGHGHPHRGQYRAGVQDTPTPAAPQTGPSYPTGPASSATTQTPQDTVSDGPVWTEDDPLGLYVDEPPAVQPRMQRPVQARRNGWLKPVVATAAVLAIVIAWNTGQSAPAAFAIGLGTLGLGMVAGAFVGRTRGLLPLGLVMVVAIALTSVFNSVPEFGDKQFTPTGNISATDTDYRIGVGSLKVDLTRVRIDDDATVRVHADLGEIEVVLPADMDVIATASATSAGDVRLLDQSHDGHQVELHVIDFGKDNKLSPHTVTLDVGVKFGEIKVVRR